MREDIAESFLTWLAVRYRSSTISQHDYDSIIQTIPNRLAYFDSIVCDLYPLVINPTAMEDGLFDGKQTPLFYPNPSEGILYLNIKPGQDWKVSLMDVHGKWVFREMRSWGKEMDLSHLPEGIYIIEIKDRASRVLTKWVKQ